MPPDLVRSQCRGGQYAVIDECDVFDTVLQDRMFAAATLMLLHLAAFFQADDVIMREIPGSHPYLTGLGILGGMYSFANPLQGTVTNHCFLRLVGAVAAPQLRLPNLWGRIALVT